METLLVRAKHFQNAVYHKPCNCPLAYAAKEQFKSDRVSEGVDMITVDGISYDHDIYDSPDFDNDMVLAEKHSFDDTVIREFRLTKIE